METEEVKELIALKEKIRRIRYKGENDIPPSSEEYDKKQEELNALYTERQTLKFDPSDCYLEMKNAYLGLLSAHSHVYSIRYIYNTGSQKFVNAALYSEIAFTIDDKKLMEIGQLPVLSFSEYAKGHKHLLSGLITGEMKKNYNEYYFLVTKFNRLVSEYDPKQKDIDYKKYLEKKQEIEKKIASINRWMNENDPYKIQRIKAEKEVEKMIKESCLGDVYFCPFIDRIIDLIRNDKCDNVKKAKVIILSEGM